MFHFLVTKNPDKSDLLTSSVSWIAIINDPSEDPTTTIWSVKSPEKQVPAKYLPTQKLYKPCHFYLASICLNLTFYNSRQFCPRCLLKTHPHPGWRCLSHPNSDFSNFSNSYQKQWLYFSPPTKVPIFGNRSYLWLPPAAFELLPTSERGSCYILQKLQSVRTSSKSDDCKWKHFIQQSDPSSTPTLQSAQHSTEDAPLIVFLSIGKSMSLDISQTKWLMEYLWFMKCHRWQPDKLLEPKWTVSSERCLDVDLLHSSRELEFDSIDHYGQSHRSKSAYAYPIPSAHYGLATAS